MRKTFKGSQHHFVTNEGKFYRNPNTFRNLWGIFYRILTTFRNLRGKFYRIRTSFRNLLRRFYQLNFSNLRGKFSSTFFDSPDCLTQDLHKRKTVDYNKTTREELRWKPRKATNLQCTISRILTERRIQTIEILVKAL